VFRRRDFFQGRALHGSEVRDIVWLQPDGAEMSDEAWQQGYAQALAVCLAGDGLQDVDTRGQPVVDDSFVLFFNAAPEAVVFHLPESQARPGGRLLIDTANEAGALPDVAFDASQPFTLEGRALALIRFPRQAAA
jgi:glycogen operon protein